MSVDKTPVQNAILWLSGRLGANNFFGRLLNACKRDYTLSHAIAAVAVTPRGRYILAVNPEEFNASAVQLQILVLLHEAGHLGLRHVARILQILTGLPEKEKAQYFQLANIAADLAVNDLILRPFVQSRAADEGFHAELQKLLLPENYGLPKGKSFEEYLELLLNNQEASDQAQKDAEGSATSDFMVVEDGEGEGAGESGDGGTKPLHVEAGSMLGDEIQRLIQGLDRNAAEALQRAVEQTLKQAGTVPGFISKTIEELKRKTTIPWNVLLRNQVKSVISSKMVACVHQPNTALYPAMDEGVEPFPGYNYEFVFRLGAYVDTSGSVDDREFQIFMSELVQIMKDFQGVHLSVVSFDHRLQHEVTITKTNTDADVREATAKIRERHGYGGTDFTPPFLRMRGEDVAEHWVSSQPETRHQIDLALVLTDGYATVASPHGPMPRLRPRCPVFWVLTPNGHADPAMQDLVLKINKEEL